MYTNVYMLCVTLCLRSMYTIYDKKAASLTSVN